MRQDHRRRFASRASHKLLALLLCALSGLMAFGQQAAASDQQSLAVIETAAYSARLGGTDLVDGRLALQVRRQGTGPVQMDWSSVRLALTDLKWQGEPAIAGLAPDGRSLVIIDEEAGELTAQWSLRGELFGETIVCDLRLPPALNSVLTLDIPADRMLTCDRGLVHEELHEDPAWRRCRVELGRVQAATLKLAPRQTPAMTTRYEVDNVHVARRDGLVVQSDLLIEGAPWRNGPLEVELPASVDVQSINVAGVSVPFKRQEDRPEIITVQVGSLVLEPRLTLRIRGFEPVTWGERHQLPRTRLATGVATKRSLSLRVEPPLQIQGVYPQGMTQTSLSSDDVLGEVWRFEAREPDGSVAVDIDFPKADLSANLDFLIDPAKGGGWAAVLVALHSENGTLYDVAMTIPEGWDLVSVAAGDVESRVASWELRGKELVVSFQNPLTPSTSRNLRLFFRCGTWKRGVQPQLFLPTVIGAEDSQATCQILALPKWSVETLEGESWDLSDQPPFQRAFLQMREVVERLPALAERTVLTFSGASRPVDSPLALQLLFVEPETVVSEASVTPERPPVDLPESTAGPTLELTSTAGPASSFSRVHHAVIRFGAPARLDDLKLRLQPNCRVSAVLIDGEPVTIFREGEGIRFPTDWLTLRELHLAYVTEADTSLLTARDEVPLPQISTPYAGIVWTLKLPGESHLESFGFPNVLMQRPPRAPLSERLFGPLARTSGERRFRPFSLNDWRALLSMNRRSTKDAVPALRTFSLSIPGSAKEATFVTWDEARHRGLAWGSLLGCLLLGSAARMFDLRWVRRLMPLWMALLLLAIVVGPPGWSSIFGGMFVGTFIAALLPRGFVQQRDVLVRAKPTTRTIVQTTAVLLLFGWGAMASGQFPKVLPPRPLSSESWPDYLIRSARYELVSRSPVPRVRGEFKIVVQDGLEGGLVRLPVRDISLASQGACKVDGEPVAVLPIAGGEAIAVPLPDVANASSNAGWSTRRIELEFSLRPLEVEGDVLHFQATIPTPLDCSLTVAGDVPLEDVRRWGDVEADDQGGRTFHLGGVGLLATQEAAAAVPSDLSAVTLLEISPLRVKGQMRIAATSGKLPERLDLRFPPGCLIQTVTGTGVMDWVQTQSADAETLLSVRALPGIEGSFANITLELPQGPTTTPNELFTIPAMRLWDSPRIPHRLGFTVPPASSVSLVPGQGVIPLGVEEWQSRLGPGRPRPALAVLLQQPQPVSLQWSRLLPERTASVAETLTVRRQELAWTATVRTSVARVPTFRHQFRLDPALHLDAVVCTDRGLEGPVRFTRHGETVTIFVTGGQLGERTYELTGRKALSIDRWRDVPLFEVLDTPSVETQLVIRDETFWNVEMETPQGTAIQVSAADNSSDQTTVGARQLATLPGTAGLRPTRLRVIPPLEVVQSKSAARIVVDATGKVELQQMFQLKTTDFPLRRAVFQIPPELKFVSLRPAAYEPVVTETPQGTRLSVRFPDGPGTTANLAMTLRLPSEIEQALTLSESQPVLRKLAIPLVRVTSARSTAQLLFLDVRLPWSPAPGTTTPLSTSPGWLRTAWQESLARQELIGFSQTQGGIDLMLTADLRESRQPRPYFEETLMWPLISGDVDLVTRTWFSRHESEAIRIQLPAGATISNVQAEDGSSPTIQRTGQICEVALDPHLSAQSLTIFWNLPKLAPGISLLQYESPFTPTRTVGMMQTADRRISFHSTPVDVDEVLLQRWESLLDCLDEPAIRPAPPESLLAAIHQSAEACAALLSTDSVTGDPDQREWARRLADRWQSRQNELATDRQGPLVVTRPGPDLFAEQLASFTGDGFVEWTAPPLGVWTARITDARVAGVGDWKGVAVSLLVLALAIALTTRFSVHWASFRETVSRFPGLSVALLGFAWWLFLSPSVVGLLLIAIGAVLLWREMFRNQLMSA